MGITNVYVIITFAKENVFVFIHYFFIRIQFINTEAESSKVRDCSFCWQNGEIFSHYKRKVCQMKPQVNRSSLSIYLVVGTSGI